MIGISKVWGLGGLGGFEGSGWVKGGLGDPYWPPFAPLEGLYGTRFGSKHHLMVQVGHVKRLGITDPFPDFRSPSRCPQRTIL